MLSASRERQKWLQSKAKEAMGSSAKSFVENAEELNGIKTVLQVLPNVGGKDLRDLAEKVKDHLGSGAMCLIGHDDEKSALSSQSQRTARKGFKPENSSEKSHLSLTGKVVETRDGPGWRDERRGDPRSS